MFYLWLLSFLAISYFYPSKLDAFALGFRCFIPLTAPSFIICDYMIFSFLLIYSLACSFFIIISRWFAFISMWFLGLTFWEIDFGIALMKYEPSVCLGLFVVLIDDDCVNTWFSFFGMLLDDFLDIDGLPWFGDLWHRALRAIWSELWTPTPCALVIFAVMKLFSFALLYAIMFLL